MVFDAKVFYVLSIETIEWELQVSGERLTSVEIQFLQEALSADYKISNIRLREGEYQYDLARTIASFHAELRFPDVKDIIRRLYDEEKTGDIQFIRKIQTILKKMEKSSILKILPKKNPWGLQRYAVSSFKFQDVDKNLLTLATDQQIKEMQSLLHSQLAGQEATVTRSSSLIRICILAIIVGASYTATVWSLIQPVIDPLIFVVTFGLAVVCSVMLGKMLSQK
jgi:hypothetical protein